MDKESYIEISENQKNRIANILGSLIEGKAIVVASLITAVVTLVGIYVSRQPILKQPEPRLLSTTLSSIRTNAAFTLSRIIKRPSVKSRYIFVTMGRSLQMPESHFRVTLSGPSTSKRYSQNTRFFWKMVNILWKSDFLVDRGANRKKLP